MRVLVCGDRNWTDIGIIARRLGQLPPDAVIIQGAARGADSLAAVLAVRQGHDVVEFIADWARYGRAAGPIRNRQMLNEGKPDLVIAFHNNIEHSKGTRDMVNIARKAGLPVEVIGGRDDLPTLS